MGEVRLTMTRHGHGQIHIQLQLFRIHRRIHVERIRRGAEHELSQVVLRFIVCPIIDIPPKIQYVSQMFE